eukprot:445925-Prymnesium_polylepis.1
MAHRTGLETLDIVGAEEYGVCDRCVHADYTTVVAEELYVTSPLLRGRIHDNRIVHLALQLFLLRFRR